MALVPPSFIIIYLIPVWSTVLFLAFHFPLLAKVCPVRCKHHRFFLAPSRRAISYDRCTIGTFWHTPINISIIAEIEMQQLEWNCWLMCLIILLFTASVMMFVASRDAPTAWHDDSWAWDYPWTRKMLSACRKRWNHWGDRSAPELRCSSSEIDSPFFRYREDVENEGQVPSVLAWRHEQGELPKHASWKYLAWWVPAESLCLVDRHDYWWRDWDFKVQRQTTCRQTYMFVWWRNADLFAI